MKVFKRTLGVLLAVLLVAAFFTTVVGAADQQKVITINKKFPAVQSGFTPLLTLKDQLTDAQLLGLKSIKLKFSPGWVKAATNGTFALNTETWFTDGTKAELSEVFFHFIDLDANNCLTIPLANPNSTIPEMNNARGDWRITQAAIDAGLTFKTQFSMWWAENDGTAKSIDVVLESVTLTYDESAPQQSTESKATSSKGTVSTNTKAPTGSAAASAVSKAVTSATETSDDNAPETGEAAPIIAFVALAIASAGVLVFKKSKK